MKYLFTILCFVVTSVAVAQSKSQQQVKENVLLLHNTIFGTKDSLTLEKMLASEVTYGHSGGKLENRKEVIDNCSHNKSSYTNINAKDITVTINHKTAVTRYILTGTETKPDGKATELKLNILQVWIKKNGWKMMARQAVKLS